MAVTDVIAVWIHAMASVSVQAGLLIVGVLVVQACCRLSSRVRCWLWCLVLVRLALPVPFESPIGLLAGAGVVESYEARAQSGGEAGATARSEDLSPVGQFFGRSFGGTLDAWTRVIGGEALGREVDLEPVSAVAWLAFALWVVGVTTLGAIRWRRQVALGHWLRQCHRPSPKLETWVDALRVGLGIRQRIRVRVAPDDALRAECPQGPVLIGAWRQTIVLPRFLAEAWPASRLEPVILHELQHARRKDPQWNVLLAWVETVYFFHPLVWLTAARLRIEREFACDDAVVARHESLLVPYARTLVGLSLQADELRVLDGLSLTRRSQLLPRVRRLLAPEPPPARPHARFSVGMVGIAAILLLAADRPQMKVVVGPEHEQEAAGHSSRARVDRFQGPGDEAPDDDALAELATLARHCDPENRPRRAALLADLATRRPDLPPELAFYLVVFSPEEEPELYQRLRAIWRRHLMPEAVPLAVLQNAAEFFSLREPVEALAIYRRLDHRQTVSAEPGLIETAIRRGELLMHLSAQADDGATREAHDLQRQAAEAFAAALRRATNDTERLGALGRAARSSARHGASTRAAAYAQQTIAVADRVPPGTTRGTAVHGAHTILGHWALAQQDVEGAIDHLMRAAQIAGSAVVASSGPELSLANDLLAMGHTAAVIAYLERCRSLWPRGVKTLAAWVEAVAHQRITRLERSPSDAAPAGAALQQADLS